MTPDLHLIWLSQRNGLSAEYEALFARNPDGEPERFDRLISVEKRIMATPAIGPNGVLAKALLFADMSQGPSPTDEANVIVAEARLLGLFPAADATTDPFDEALAEFWKCRAAEQAIPERMTIEDEHEHGEADIAIRDAATEAFRLMITIPVTDGWRAAEKLRAALDFYEFAASGMLSRDLGQMFAEISDSSAITVALGVGWQSFPFAAKAIASSTATCTFYELK